MKILQKSFEEEEAVAASISANIDYRCIQHAAAFYSSTWYDFFKYDLDLQKEVRSRKGIGSSNQLNQVNINYVLLAEYWASKFLGEETHWKPTYEHTKTGVFWQSITSPMIKQVKTKNAGYKNVSFVSNGDNLFISIEQF